MGEGVCVWGGGMLVTEDVCAVMDEDDEVVLHPARHSESI